MSRTLREDNPAHLNTAAPLLPIVPVRTHPAAFADACDVNAARAPEHAVHHRARAAQAPGHLCRFVVTRLLEIVKNTDMKRHETENV